MAKSVNREGKTNKHFRSLDHSGLGPNDRKRLFSSMGRNLKVIK